MEQRLRLRTGPFARDVRLPWHSAGLRAEAAAGVVLVLLVGALSGYQYLLGQTSPQALLTGYLSSLQRGDAEGAWSRMTVEAPGSGVDTTLLTEAGLKAALTDAANRTRFPELRLGAGQTTSAGATIPGTYKGPSGVEHTEFRLRSAGTRYLGVFPAWRVIVTPTVLAITRPIGSGALSVDGIAVAVQPGASIRLGAFPGDHRVAVAGSTLVLAAAQAVTGAEAGQQVTVQLQPGLTEAAQKLALDQVSKAFIECAAKVDVAPAGCPESFPNASSAKDVRWQLVGDPLASAKVASTGSAITVEAHYQMLLTYFDSAVNGVQHVAVAGPYRASLALDGDSLKLATLVSASDVAPLQRPTAITDAAVEDAVRLVFARCAATTSFHAPDCPMGITRSDGASGTSVSWKFNGDPLSGAAVTFDGASGSFKVTGSFSMVCSYDLSGLVGFHHDDTDTGTFSATAWNG